MRVYDLEGLETSNDSRNIGQDISKDIGRCIHIVWDTLTFSYKKKIKITIKSLVYIFQEGSTANSLENTSDTISDYKTEKEIHTKECVGGGESHVSKQMIFNAAFASLRSLGNIRNNRPSHLDLLLAFSGNLTHAQSHVTVGGWNLLVSHSISRLLMPFITGRDAIRDTSWWDQRKERETLCGCVRACVF